MSWFNLWDGLKTKTCRYLLQRYLGQFFENNLNLEQLKVDLYNGKAVVEDISLKVNALNDLFEEQGWAFEVISGHIGCLTAMVPWNALMTNDSSLSISNMTITLRPVTRSQSGTTMLESMWSSVSSSMQMAEECMKQIDDDIPFLNHNNTLIGLEKLSETIDNVLNRIHATLKNTTINIEYTLPKSLRKLIISIKFNHVEYKNQTGTEKYSTSFQGSNSESGDQPQTLTSLPMIAKHNLVTNGFTIYTAEIDSQETYSDKLMAIEQLCKIVEFKGRQNFNICVKQTENIVGPKINLEMIIDDIYFMLTPRQIQLLIRISKGFTNTSPKDKLLKQYADIKSDVHNAFHPSKMTGVIERDGEWGSDAGDLQKSVYMYSDIKNQNCESVLSLTSTNSMTTSYSIAQKNMGPAEKSGEILKFKIQIFKIVGAFLQNDILLENKPKSMFLEYMFNNESYSNYSEIANTFFDENSCHDSLIRIKNINYLSFMVSCLLVNGNQQRFCNELTMKTSLSATTVDLSEILENVEYPLITFDRNKNCNEGYHTRPEVSLSHVSSYFYKQNCNRSTNKIECNLDDCTVDFDISIYDRLSALFGISAFAEEYDMSETTPASSNPLDIQIKCSLIKLHLRFPIVDGRLPFDPMKISCWKKNIRNDYLSFNFQNILIMWKSCINVIIDELDGFYCDGTVYHIINCSSNTNDKKVTTDKEKITVKIKIMSEDEKCNITKSNYKPNRKSPFSSKCVYGYSSTVEGLNDNTDKNDIFLPGETEEINEFCTSSKYASDIQICASVPKVKIVLECKELYEKIYNRINGDLLMWEPRSPLTHEDEILSQAKHHFPELRNPNPISYDNSLFNICSFDLCFEDGTLIVYTDVQDVEKGSQQSNHSILQLNFKEFRLFSVTGFNYDKNLSYFCLQLNEMDVYHSGEMLVNLTDAWNDAVCPNLFRIIYSFPLQQRILNNRHEMISLVTELKKQQDRRLKRIKLAFGINGAILVHKPSYAANNWIYQLMDFFDIREYPIEAYEPYALISEIQGHMWNSAIQYRPKYLPYRAFVEIGTCALSSNIIYPMTGCTLRLMTEDCIISIGPITKDLAESNTGLNYAGLVPVLNIGLLNISIRLDENNKQCPNIDLRSSIHEVHLKTCYDSADALAQLIAYIANDKDLIPIDKNICDKSIQSSVSQSDKNSDDIINKLMADAVKDVEITVSSSSSNEKNICESIKSEDQHWETTEESKVYELESMLQSYYHPSSENSLPQIQADLEATSNTFTQEERDYDVIQDNFMDNFGVEQIYVSEDPLQIVDNHFCLPSEKTDLLRPPGNFPTSEQSYTLCEMTFTWHLYGGKDFPEKSSNSKGVSNRSSTRIGMSETYKHGVSEVPKDSKLKIKNAAFDRPSISDRNLNVLVEIQFSKIRFSYDIYPVNSIYSSRQALIISDIEVRDRLLISDINKLLYHPYKNSKPQKTDEHMINVKALSVRSNLKNRAEECSLRVSVLPIKLNIDQGTLMFLEEFFCALIERSANATNNKDVETNVPIRDEPVLHDLKQKDDGDQYPADPLRENSANAIEEPSSNDPIYFKEFIFSPSLPICFDYHGRKIELSRGPITGLLMGLAQLQGSEIRLREVINRRGVLGWNKLFEFLCREWLKDIKRNQLPNILSGIGPTNAVLQLFQGFFDLFRLPLQQYNKDGRIMRGFQLGAQSFSARTAFAALEITSRIIHLLQFTAETTFDILSVGPSLNRRRKSKSGKKRQDRPKDIREGVANAYFIVKEGINESANTLLEAAAVEHDQKGYSGAVGAVVRQIPQLVVCPAVLATQATTNILGGAKSSLVPEAKREARDKWKHDNI